MPDFFPPPTAQKPLEKDVIEKNREFFPTQAEYNSKQKDAKVYYVFKAGSGTSTLCTIPAGQTLVITGMSITGRNDSNVNEGRAVIYISSGYYNEDGIIFALEVTNESDGSNSINLSMPLVVNGGDTIKAEVSGNMDASFFIFGYLEDKEIFK